MYLPNTLTWIVSNCCVLKFQIDWKKKGKLRQLFKGSANRERARTIDKLSRILFPVVFLIFNTIYWFFYLFWIPPDVKYWNSILLFHIHFVQKFNFGWCFILGFDWSLQNLLIYTTWHLETTSCLICVSYEPIYNGFIYAIRPIRVS